MSLADDVIQKLAKAALEVYHYLSPPMSNASTPYYVDMRAVPLDEAWRIIREALAPVEAREAALVEALTWLLHLRCGVSKGGDEYSPPSDAEWRDAWAAAEQALAPYERKQEEPK